MNDKNISLYNDMWICLNLQKIQKFGMKKKKKLLDFCIMWLVVVSDRKLLKNSQSRLVIISHEENELDIEYIKLDILYFFLYNFSFPSFLSINFLSTLLFIFF